LSEVDAWVRSGGTDELSDKPDAPPELKR